MGVAQASCFFGAEIGTSPSVRIGSAAQGASFMKKERGHTWSSTTRTLSAKIGLDAEIVLRKTEDPWEMQGRPMVLALFDRRRSAGR